MKIAFFYYDSESSKGKKKNKPFSFPNISAEELITFLQTAAATVEAIRDKEGEKKADKEEDTLEGLEPATREFLEKNGIKSIVTFAEMTKEAFMKLPGANEFLLLDINIGLIRNRYKPITR